MSPEGTIYVKSAVVNHSYSTLSVFIVVVAINPGLRFGRVRGLR
jgi:hypothetical protein